MTKIHYPAQFSRLLLSAVFVCYFLSYKAQASVTVEEALALANGLFPRAIPLRHRGTSTAGTGIDGKKIKCYRFVGPEEESIEVDVDLNTGTLCRFYWGLQMRTNRTKKISQQGAQQVAVHFLDTYCPPTIRNSLELENSNYYERGVYVFTYRVFIGGIRYPGLIRIEVGATTGTVVHYWIIQDVVTLKNFVPTISEGSAFDIISAKIGYPIRDLKKRSYLSIMVDGKTQTLTWIILLTHTPDGTYSYGISYNTRGSLVFYLNATTGEWYGAYNGRLTMKETPQAPSPNRKALLEKLPAGFRQLDQWATFTGNDQCILYVKWRERENDAMPKIATATSVRSVVAMADDTAQTALLETNGYIVRFPAWSESGNRAAIKAVDGPIFVIDTETGAIGRCNDDQRSNFAMPSLSPDGSLLAVSGAASDAERLANDIYVGQVQKQLSYISLRGLHCVAKMTGHNILPTFGPDGKTLVFAHQDDGSPGAKDPLWSLYLVAADKGVRAVDYEKPHKIAGNLLEPERLSWFPDGRRLVVSYAADESDVAPLLPETVEVATGMRQRLLQIALRDPEQPGLQPLQPREVAISGDGGRMVFSARRWSGNSKDLADWCIFSCKLDGSELRRITRPGPLVLHKYPQAGITAANAWVKLLPQPNHGVPWTAETQRLEHEADLKKMQEFRDKQAAQAKVQAKVKETAPAVP